MEDYLSDEDLISDSDSDSFGFQNNDLGSEFSIRNQNNQFETLKQLKNCLNENKLLKKRLEIVESELENLLEYKSFLPLVDREDKTTITDPIIIDEPIPISTSTKATQANIEIKIATPPPVVVKEKTLIILPKSDIETQCDDNYWSDKQLIEKLSEELLNLKEKGQKEKDEFLAKIDELNTKNDELTSRLGDSQKMLDTSNAKLTEYLKTNIKLGQEVDDLKDFKSKYGLLMAENDELVKNLGIRQKDLEEANFKVLELTKNLSESLELSDKQKRLIDEIEQKNKNVIEKFMDECLKLEKENYDLKQNKEGLETEVKKLTESVFILNKEVDRYKADLKNFNFKEFVSIKRELKELKEERERYFANIVTMPQANLNQSSSPLPPIKPIKKNLFNFFNN